MTMLTILIGLPGCGKSTWVQEQNFPENTVIVSSDDYIEAAAKEQGKTYTEVFRDEIEYATDLSWRDFTDALSKGLPIVIDRTNLTVESRRKFIELAQGYYKVAVYFPVPEDIETRISSRTGKIIPVEARQSMLRRLQLPTVNEGFDQIYLNT